MKQPEFLKNIHIGEIIHTEMKKQQLTVQMLADRVCLKKWKVRYILQQENISINKLINFSYALHVNFLLVYLQKMPQFKNTKPHYEDEVIIKTDGGQIAIILSKKSRTTDFLQFIHIGALLHREAKEQKMTEESLADILCCTQGAISEMFHHTDIDMYRLIRMSYILNYDFIRNIYLPYMCVNPTEMIANDCIADLQVMKITPKTISIITDNNTMIYHKIELQQ